MCYKFTFIYLIKNLQVHVFILVVKKILNLYYFKFIIFCKLTLFLFYDNIINSDKYKKM